MQAVRTQAPPQPPPPAGSEAPLRGLLAVLAEEIGDLAQSADRLQLLFGQLISDPPVRPDDILEQAQTLDGLVQRLQGVKAFLAGLRAHPLDDLPRASALAATRLRLTSQARRFSPQADAAGDAQAPAGDCDLF